MPPLVFCRKSDGSFVPAGAASRIVLKIKLGPVCKTERVPTPEDVRSLSSKKLQARECSLLRTLLIQNALGTLNETNNLGLCPPQPDPTEDDLDLGSDNSSDGEREVDPLDDSGVFDMDSDGQDSLDSSTTACNDENTNKNCANVVFMSPPSPKKPTLHRRTVRINATTTVAPGEHSESAAREHSPSKRPRQCGRDNSILNYELQSIIGCV